MTTECGKDTNDYVRYLEGKVEKLVKEVRKLKSEAAHAGGRRGNLREMRVTYKWTEEDLDCSEKVMKFCSEYLFPRFKFLSEGWIVNDTTNKKSFFAFVKRHLPLPDNMDFDEKWTGLIAPALAKKYTDMRCNINSAIRTIFCGEYSVFIFHFFLVNVCQ